MRSIRFLPIAFIAGVHGFLIFAPYAAVLLAGQFLLKRRAGQAIAIPVAVNADPV